MDAPSNIPVAFRPIYHTFSNSWYIILCRCFYTKTRPFPFLQVAGRGFALQGGNLSAQNSWLGPGTQHQLFRIAMVCHHSSSFSSILSIFSIAMTCNDYLYNLGIFGNIWGIPWIFPFLAASIRHIIAMPRRCLDAKAMAPGHFTHASLYLCFVTSLLPGL
jgi:hypothetical protein